MKKSAIQNTLSLRYAALNNCLDDNCNEDIIKEIKNNLNTKDHNKHIRNINQNHLKLSNEEYSKLVKNLDYQLFLDSLKFINDINDSKNWNCILDNCYKKTFIDKNLVKFFDKISVRDIFSFFRIK